MAKRTVTVVVDDLTGEESTEAETVRFGFGFASYEIDLGPDSRAKFEEALEPYISVARRVAGSSSSSGPARRSTSGARTDLAQVREWANANGHAVSSRGRVSQSVLDAYDAAN